MKRYVLAVVVLAPLFPVMLVAGVVLASFLPLVLANFGHAMRLSDSFEVGDRRIVR